MARRIIRVLAFFVGVQLAGCATNQPLETTERSCVMGPPDASVACTQEYDPVCGCDGKTYPNACVARAQGVPWSEPGPCEDDRLD